MADIRARLPYAIQIYPRCLRTTLGRTMRGNATNYFSALLEDLLLGTAHKGRDFGFPVRTPEHGDNITLAVLQLLGASHPFAQCSRGSADALSTNRLKRKQRS